ncbi:hypothetical protein [Marinobacterium lutimaris]|uniref:RNA polymerase sigma factor, sigma-70 family n=1 Tax=Marinobacterium lutimaris TaxID=568106 RepID=A0A1H5YRG7_9GAMM|nr:hypothetical protein [Marinobacterium lutimaris]SEG26215.1 RNA polymerase sigma factor, sigma-70 family [Marinobacterium lutimaris]
MDWSAIVFDQQTQGRISALCERRFGKTVDAEVASQYVLEKLSADDWQLCRKFTGRSLPQTYLYTLCSNLIEEHARKQYGRIRPPAWLKQLGDTWLTLWKLICLERQPVPAAIERLAGRDETLRNSDGLLDMVRTIKARLPWCGQQTGAVTTEQEPEEEAHTPAAQSDSSIEALLLLLHQVVLKQEPENKAQTQDALNNLGAEFTLDDEQRLVLRMAYVDGMKFSAIARALNLPAHKPARVAKQALAELRSVLQRHNLLPEELL